MPYIGNTPADKFLTLAKQSFSTSATTSYTLDSAVSSTQDIALFINSVRQSPVDAYSVSGTALTLTSATAGTDEMYCVYLGKTVGTVSPASDSVTTAMIQSNAVNNAKMADDAIGLAELSATGTPSSSNFLRGDNSWAAAGGGKVVQYAIASDSSVGTNGTSSYATTGLEHAFTPTDANNKIFIQCYTPWAAENDGSTNASGRVGYFAIYKDSSIMSDSQSVFGQDMAASSTAALPRNYGTSLLYATETAGSTSARTYKLMAKGSGASVVTFNYNNVVDSESYNTMNNFYNDVLRKAVF